MVQPLAGDDPRSAGVYRLLFRLGEGGMGRVYLGRSPGGRAVAVKMVHPGLAGAPGFRERFAREVRAAQAVSGAGAVPVVAADPDGAVPWLASAYVAGPSLADAVHEHGPLPEPAVWRLLSGLAQALGAVHGHSLVHRDLKPSNVLLSLDGPLLIDFGIARAADDTALTGTGLVVGSPGYMSPEQAEGRKVAAASDIFALGAVLAYAATGRGPFGGGSSPELLYRVVHRDPDLDGIPEELAAVVGRCLAKEPGERPALDELRTAAADHAAESADWLPGPISSAIARKAEHLLNLDAADAADSADAAAPTTTSPAAGTPPAHSPTQVDPHASIGPAPTPPPQQPQPQPQAAPYTPPYPHMQQRYTPYPHPAYRVPVRPGTFQNPGYQPADPRRRVWVAPWVQGRALGKPLLSLLGLIPLIVLSFVGSDVQELAARFPSSPSDRQEYEGLVDWALQSSAPSTLAFVLFWSLIVLQIMRGQLWRYSVPTVRVWTAATGGYWLLWAIAVIVGLVWTMGILIATDPTYAGDDPDFYAYVLTACVCLALIPNTLVTPFTAIGAAIRLTRAFTGDVARPAAPG